MLPKKKNKFGFFLFHQYLKTVTNNMTYKKTYKQETDVFCTSHVSYNFLMPYHKDMFPSPKINLTDQIKKCKLTMHAYSFRYINICKCFYEPI